LRHGKCEKPRFYLGRPNYAHFISADDDDENTRLMQKHYNTIRDTIKERQPETEEQHGSLWKDYNDVLMNAIETTQTQTMVQGTI
jgi:hypothetical protein